MKWILASIATAAAVANAADITAIQKVVQMLQGMVDKGKKEKHEETVMFAKYKQFCTDTLEDKKRSIEEATSAIAKLGADIKKYSADSARLGREVAEHESDIATWNGDLNAAQKVRDTEHGDYEVNLKDYSESADAINRAIKVLKQQAGDRKQAGEALLQIDALIPLADKKVVNAFLQTDPEIFLEQEPKANAYEFQSGGVVAMLEKLKAKFQDELDTLMKEETNGAHAHKMLVQELTSEVKHAEKSVGEKKEEGARLKQAKGEAEGDKGDYVATKKSDVDYSTELRGECEQKAIDYEQRQQLRADEITAIEKAIEIMSSDKVSGAGGRNLPQLVQTSLIQLRTAIGDEEAQQRAVSFLSQQADKVHSRILAQLAATAAADPFGKVKRLIQDLITRLMEEANTEATKKGFCDKELADNKATRDEKTTAVKKLSAEIDQLQASIEKRGEVIETATAEIAASDKAVAEATVIRNESKESNTLKIKEAKEAQEAVTQAMQVLKDFYAKAGTATALIQQKPEVFDKPYKGMGGEGGVVGMLEVILTDFARLESETTAQEETEESEHDKFLQKSELNKKQMEKDVEHNKMSKQNEEQALGEKTGDKEGNQKQLDAANDEFDKLKPQCIDTGVSYEERVAKREQEVQSLQEALKILQGDM